MNATVKKAFILAVVAVLARIDVQAQAPFAHLVADMPTTGVPFKAAKEMTKRSYGIPGYKGYISAKLYEDIQCTSYFMADTEESAPDSYAKFRIPDTPHYLFVASFGGPTDYLTDLLVVVDSEGHVLDTLEASVWYFPGIAVKQYEVTENYEVIIHMLKPLAPNSISFADFSSFPASRMSKTYRITDGKFVLQSEKSYRPQIYTRSRLEQETYNIWNGQEQIL